MNKKIMLMSALALVIVFDVLPAARRRKHKAQSSTAVVTAASNVMSKPVEIDQCALEKAAADLFKEIKKPNRSVSKLKKCLKNELLRSKINEVFDTTSAIGVYGRTALDLVCALAWIDGIEVLMNAGASWSAPSCRLTCQLSDKSQGATALHVLASVREFDAADEKVHARIKNLIQRNAGSIEVKDIEGWTPLMYACQEGNFNTVKILIECGANIHHCDLRGYSVLSTAAHGLAPRRRIDHDSCVQLLLEKGASSSIYANDGMSVLHAAAQHNFVDCLVQFLQQPDIDLNPVYSENGFTPLHAAVSKSAHECIRILVADLRTDLLLKDKDGNTALDIAYTRRDSTSMKILKDALTARYGTEKIATPSSAESSSAEPKMNQASSSESNLDEDEMPELVQQPLISEPLSQEQSKSQEQSNFFAEICARIKRGMDVNTVIDNILGWTPLFYAVNARNVETVNYLLQRGARQDILDELGDTPLKVLETSINEKGSTDETDVIKLLLIAHPSTPRE
jgi:ankyrin repeat protein